MRKIAVLAAVLASLAACAGTPAPAGTDITAAQFQSDIVGKTLKYQSADARYAVSSVSTYKPDGSLTGDWSSGGKSGHYEATWKLNGNLVCVTEPNSNGGGTTCRAWRMTAPKVYAEVNPDGSLHGTTTVTQ